MGLTFALAWFGVGMLILVTSLLVTGSTGADVPYPVGFGAFGFVAGVAFSGILGLVEGRRSFDKLSTPRFCLWGAVGGVILAAGFVSLVSLIEGPAFFSNILVLGPVFGAAGAVSAGGALTLAKRVKDDHQIGPAESGAEIVPPTDQSGLLGEGR